jgi:hypothetical protein
MLCAQSEKQLNGGQSALVQTSAGAVEPGEI